MTQRADERQLQPRRLSTRTCRQWSLVGAALMIGVTMILLARIPDPVTIPGTFVTGDNRRHRLGDWSYEQTTALIARLTRQAKEPNTQRQLAALVQLARVFRLRRMPVEAAAWLNRGRAVAPHDPELLQEEKRLQQLLAEGN